MFSFATVSIATNLYTHIKDLIDNRDFPGDDESPPGPFGYFLNTTEAVYLVPLVSLVLNGWFGDGLLVCSVPDFTDQLSHMDLPPVISLPRHLCDEQLGYRSPMLTIHCLIWCGVEFLYKRTAEVSTNHR